MRKKEKNIIKKTKWANNILLYKWWKKDKATSELIRKQYSNKIIYLKNKNKFAEIIWTSAYAESFIDYWVNFVYDYVVYNTGLFKTFFIIMFVMNFNVIFLYLICEIFFSKSSIIYSPICAIYQATFYTKQRQISTRF